MTHEFVLEAINLLESYIIDGDISAAEFDGRFNELFVDRRPASLDPGIYALLDTFQTDVDFFEPDEEKRRAESFLFGEDKLEQLSRELLHKLHDLTR